MKNNITKITSAFVFLAFCLTAIITMNVAEDSSADIEAEDMGTYYSYNIQFTYQGDIGESVESDELNDMITWSFSDDDYTEEYNGVTIIHTFTQKGIQYVKCVATNSEYSTTKYYKINIYGPPTITFVTNGGSDVETITMSAYDQLATEPTAPTKDGFTFGGWYKNEGLTIPFNWNEEYIISPVTLYAKWLSGGETTYTITFVTNGGNTVAPIEVISGMTPTKPTDPVRTGYTFTRWYTDAELKHSYDWSSTVTGDMTLYAGWVRNTTTQYTITLDSNGGSEVSSITVDVGSKATEPTAPTREGYTFGGWYKDSEFTQAVDWNAAITGNVTFYAKWTENDEPTPTPSEDGEKPDIANLIKENLWVVFAVLCGIFAYMYFVSYIQNPLVLILMVGCGVLAALFGLGYITLDDVREMFPGLNI